MTVRFCYSCLQGWIPLRTHLDVITILFRYQFSLLPFRSRSSCENDRPTLHPLCVCFPTAESLGKFWLQWHRNDGFYNNFHDPFFLTTLSIVSQWMIYCWKLEVWRAITLSLFVNVFHCQDMIALRMFVHFPNVVMVCWDRTERNGVWATFIK